MIEYAERTHKHISYLAAIQATDQFLGTGSCWLLVEAMSHRLKKGADHTGGLPRRPCFAHFPLRLFKRPNNPSMGGALPSRGLTDVLVEWSDGVVVLCAARHMLTESRRAARVKDTPRGLTCVIEVLEK